jgi:hypothetical protein
MTAAELSPVLVRFLQTSIPSFSAAEILLFLVDHGEQEWAPEAIVQAMQPTAVTLQEVEQALALFRAQGLVREQPPGRFRYAGTTAAVAELAQAYRERPVTLIRTIYALADLKIQSFADSFRLKKD